MVPVREDPHMYSQIIRTIANDGKVIQSMGLQHGTDGNIYLRLAQGWVALYEIDKMSQIPIHMKPVMERLIEVPWSNDYPIHAVVKSDFSSEERTSTLDVSEGELVVVMQETALNWCLVQNYAGQHGWAPRFYLRRVEVINDQKDLSPLTVIVPAMRLYPHAPADKARLSKSHLERERAAHKQARTLVQAARKRGERERDKEIEIKRERA